MHAHYSLKATPSDVDDGMLAAQLDQATLAATLLAALLVGLLVLGAARYSSRRAAAAAGGKQQRGKGPRPAPRGYTAAEVARHAAEGDLWLSLRLNGGAQARVYDVSAYVDQHPGGDAIFDHAGGDATEGFHGPQHPPTVFDLVEEYYIGWLVEE